MELQRVTLLSAAQCHPGTRGGVQPRVRGAPGLLREQSRYLQPQQVVVLGVARVGSRDPLATRAALTPSLPVLSSTACLPSRFPKPPQPIILKDCQVLPLPPDLPLTQSQEVTPGAPPAGPQPRPPTVVDPNAEPTLLRHPQVRAQTRWKPPQGGGRGTRGGSGPLSSTTPWQTLQTAVGSAVITRSAHSPETFPAGHCGLHHSRTYPGPLCLLAARLPAGPPHLPRGGTHQWWPRLAG